MLNSTNPAWLQYNIFDTDGNTNLLVDQGSVTFWFAPNWASTNQSGGTGPRDWARLLEIGSHTSDASYGWWSLYLDPEGTNVYFSGQNSVGLGADYLSVPISWTSNYWHSIALTYSSTNSSLYVDGVLATNGSGVSYFPGLPVLTNGFWIGSDSNGLVQARGMFDDVRTYDRQLSNKEISDGYSSDWIYYYGNPWNAMLSLTSAPPSSSAPPTLNAITGAGFLQLLGAAGSCFTSSNVWLTNVVCVTTNQSTNISANFTFEIAGGAGGVPYDAFATTVLASTNGAWSWMGQGNTCNVYTITNMPVPAAFLILGTQQDSDSDGLTDAFEKLVSHTNPFVPDTSGDGLSDLYKVLYGLPINTIVPIPSLSSISIPVCAVP